MKTSFLSTFIARLGWSLGLWEFEQPTTAEAPALDPRHVARARASARRLRAHARARKLGTFTNEELLSFVRQGRR